MAELRESCPLVTISVSDSNELIGKNHAGEIVLRVPGRKADRGLKVQPTAFAAEYGRAVKLGLIKPKETTSG